MVTTDDTCTIFNSEDCLIEYYINHAKDIIEGLTLAFPLRVNFPVEVPVFDVDFTKKPCSSPALAWVFFHNTLKDLQNTFFPCQVIAC